MSWREVDIIFGHLSQSVVCECSSPALQILGFIPSDRSVVFTSMTPVKVGPGYLQALATAMIQRDSDAVAYSDRDLILRVYLIGDPTNPASQSIVLFLCVPSKPLFDSRGQDFNYPDFSLRLFG
jgi:hypothetical protein